MQGKENILKHGLSSLHKYEITPLMLGIANNAVFWRLIRTSGDELLDVEHIKFLSSKDTITRILKGLNEGICEYRMTTATRVGDGFVTPRCQQSPRRFLEHLAQKPVSCLIHVKICCCPTSQSTSIAAISDN